MRPCRSWASTALLCFSWPSRTSLPFWSGTSLWPGCSGAEHQGLERTSWIRRDWCPFHLGVLSTDTGPGWWVSSAVNAKVPYPLQLAFVPRSRSLAARCPGQSSPYERVSNVSGTEQSGVAQIFRGALEQRQSRGYRRMYCPRHVAKPGQGRNPGAVERSVISLAYRPPRFSVPRGPLDRRGGHRRCQNPFHWHAPGRLRLGGWGPWPPTGNSIDIKEFIFFRLAGGKIVEMWDSWDRPSLDKMAFTCFSTADSESTSAAPIAPLVLPCAISRNTSNSRGLSRLTGESARRAR